MNECIVYVKEDPAEVPYDLSGVITGTVVVYVNWQLTHSSPATDFS